MEFKKLDVWTSSKQLSLELVRLFRSIDDKTLFPIVNQAIRSAISVPSNIAEGCGRQYKKETIQFMYIARGSLYELETQILILHGLGEVAEKEAVVFNDKIIRCKRLLNGMIKYLNSNKALK